MTFRGQSSTSSRTFRYSSASTQPPARKNFQYDVPTGTVASRVQLLQSLANPISARRPPATSIRRRENSRTGFGRRLTSRFAEPASRNNNPDEQSQVETAHSFLGLSTPRKNHEEEHAMASHRGTISYRTPSIQGQEVLGMVDPKAMLHRTPGIHGQIEPQGVKQRVQYDAASPWPALSKAGSSQSIDQARSRYLTQTSNLPGASQQDILEPFRYTSTRQHGTVGSEASILTTSTVRRQSVRELFQDYGIERPARLASSEDTTRGIDGASRPARPHRYCHVCSWITIRPSTKCWRCGHQHCTDCDALSPILEMDSRQSNANNTTNVSREKVHSVSKPNPKENRSQVQENVRSPTRPGPKPVQEPHRKQSSSPIKFPSFDAQVPAVPKRPRTSPLQKFAVPEQPNTVRMLSGHRVTTSVKESPFVIADMLSVPVGIPISSPCDGRHSRHSLRTKWRHHHRSCSSSLCSVEEEYDDSRHQNQYKRRQSKRQTPKPYHLYEETDNGYIADRSRVEDMAHSHSHESRPHSRPNSRPNSRHFCAHQNESQHKHYDHDLVECHGYPRTGHDRRGSPTSSGIIGECQHCLNDCQCSACQNTHHSVRCCVHNDHQSITHHHHHTPRKENVANPMDRQISPPKTPSPRPFSQTGSPARTMSTMFPPSQHKETSPPGIEEAPKLPTPKSEGTTPKLQKSLSFLRSKKSTAAKEGSKGPTPPPWVSTTQRTNKSARGSTLKEETKQQSIDHTFSITPIPKPPSPYQDISTPLPSQDRETKYERPQSYKSTSRKHSVIEGKRILTPSRCSTPQRNNVSPPGSRRASRRLSALFQLRERNAVPLLNQKLVEHQEELKRTEKQIDERTEGFLRGSRVPPNQNNQIEHSSKQIGQDERSTSVANGTVKKMKLKLKVVDKEPSPIYAGEEHRLSDDVAVYNDGNTRSLKADEMHECIWKRMFLEEQHEREDREICREGNCGIQGVTVLLHFEGRDDLVFKGELSSGGTLRVMRN